MNHNRPTLGFTLVEMLLVVSLIVLLIALLLPALQRSRAAAEEVGCIVNLKQVGSAVKEYSIDYRNTTHQAPNNGKWEWPLGNKLSPDDSNAYWGVAYGPYLGSRSAFRCPSAKAMDPDDGYTDWENQPECTYGLNRHMSGRRFSKYLDAANTILAHDAFEHLLEGSNDSLSAWYGTINISQWRHRGGLYEYYRHAKESNVLWMDMHVSSIPESDGTDIPVEWYMGVN